MSSMPQLPSASSVLAAASCGGRLISGRCGLEPRAARAPAAPRRPPRRTCPGPRCAGGLRLGHREHRRHAARRRRSKCSAHSSRVRVRNTSANRCPQRRPARLVVLVGQRRSPVRPRPSSSVGVELRLDRADRHVAAVGASRSSRRTARRRRAGSCRARRTRTPPRAMPPNSGAISSAAPSTIAASTTWPAPDGRALDQRGAARPSASSIPPPPKSPTRLSGGGRRLAGAADVRRARRRARCS